MSKGRSVAVWVGLLMVAMLLVMLFTSFSSGATLS